MYVLEDKHFYMCAYIFTYSLYIYIYIYACTTRSETYIVCMQLMKGESHGTISGVCSSLLIVWLFSSGLPFSASPALGAWVNGRNLARTKSTCGHFKALRLALIISSAKC